VDITFAEPKDVEEVTRDNCFNSTTPDNKPIIGFQQVYATTSSPAPHNVVMNGYMSILVPMLLVAGLGIAWL
jgi:hypothetical protein